MLCLFSINKRGTIVICPEARKLSPELANLSEDEMRCLILAYDHHSIYRQFPEDERQRRARASVFGHEEQDIFKRPKIKKAIEAYKGLQYDPIRNHIVMLRMKLDNLNVVLESTSDDDLKRLKEVMAVAATYQKAIREWEAELNKEEEEGLQEDSDKVKLSFLERLQGNQEKYKEIMKGRPKGGIDSSMADKLRDKMGGG